MLQINILEEKLKVEEGIYPLLKGVYEAARTLYKDLKGIDFSFVGNDLMREINSSSAGNDYATDVLSFAYDETQISFAHEPMGEVIICFDIAVRQAQEKGHTLDYEIAYLFTHGLLHVLGFDHQDQAQLKDMDRRTLEVLGVAKIKSL